MPTIELLAEIEALKEMLYKSETQAEQYRSELAALKKDARILATANVCPCEKCTEAARRILTATKEADK